MPDQMPDDRPLSADDIRAMAEAADVSVEEFLGYTREQIEAVRDRLAAQRQHHIDRLEELDTEMGRQVVAAAEHITGKPEIVCDFGMRPGRPLNAPCPLCAGEVDSPLMFGLAVKGGDRICEDCSETHMPPGSWELMDGLDVIHTALSIAEPAHRASFMARAVQAINWMGETFATEEV
jgi:hypothetical protein